MNKAHTAQEAPCEIRMGQVGLAQLRLRTKRVDAIQAELQARHAAAPQLFERAPVCLDLASIDEAVSVDELRALVEVIRGAGFLPVGLMQSEARAESLAQALDLPLFAQWRAQPKPALGALLKDISPPGRSAPPKVEPPPPAPVATSTSTSAANSSAPIHAQIQHQPVRSGQRLYARSRDLIVMAPVGAGAEVIADGCVHVYGSLRGRAVAGARGETTARVFCQEFNAELVSIAGVFRVFETVPPDLAGKPVQAWLDGEELHFARLGA